MFYVFAPVENMPKVKSVKKAVLQAGTLMSWLPSNNRKSSSAGLVIICTRF